METDREIGIIDWFIEVKTTQNIGLPFGDYFFSDDNVLGSTLGSPYGGPQAHSGNLDVKKETKTWTLNS